MPQIKLGWWRDRDGFKHEVIDGGPNKLWRSTNDRTWGHDGSYWCDGSESHYDLIEFLRPLEELAPKLNSSVKAAEDRVRQLKQMVDETQTAWATACRLHDAAQKELERLEKECEVKP